MGFVALVFISRLFYLQIIEDKFKESAENQAIRYITQYASRGLIYDRNDKIIVYNQVAYDLMVIPKQVSKQIDTAAFCQLIAISTEEFVERMEAARDYSSYKPSQFEKLIPAEDWGAISEQLYKYKGFFGQKRTLRKYPFASAAHVLGYTGEADDRTLQGDAYYKRGDYVGISGLEKSYEEELRGVRGVKVYLVDVHNTIKGTYKNGKLDSLPESGANLYTTLDIDLQQYAEQLMQNKKGSVVAIEPATGEVLTLVSSPAYDPNI